MDKTVVEVGKYNTLTVKSVSGSTIYLDAEKFGEVFLQRDQVPENCQVGDEIKVFLYFDKQEQTVATLDKPFATVGEFACLEVVSVTEMGAFLDWGLPKDLFVSRREQDEEMEEGQYYVVYVYCNDRRNRLAGSSMLDNFVSKEKPLFEENQKVHLLICYKTDLGYNAIINNSYWGLIYQDEIFKELGFGQKMDAYIKKVRPDGKIDLSLEPVGYQKMDALEGKILAKIEAEGGTLEMTDKTPPEIIYETFGVSKKKFKMAMGSLYKAKRIIIADDVIRLK